MMAERIPSPNACRHCGLGQRGHFQQITEAAGRHGFTEPTDAQRLERMLARRARRLAPRPVYAPPPAELRLTLPVDTGPLDRALTAASEGLRELAAARGWEAA